MKSRIFFFKCFLIFIEGRGDKSRDHLFEEGHNSQNLQGSKGGIYILNIFNVYLFLRERERKRQSASGGGSDREGDTESEEGSRL